MRSGNLMIKASMCLYVKDYSGKLYMNIKSEIFELKYNEMKSFERAF